MAEQEKSGAKTGGRFAKGQSGNPAGRPKKKALRADAWENGASGHGTIRDRRTLTGYGVDIVTDLMALRLWRSEWLAAKIIEKKPREIFRRGYEIKAEGADPKEIAKVLTRAQELKLDAAAVQAEEFRTAYGGGAIYGAMSGAIGELSQPLVEANIQSVDAFHVLEPRELQPLTYYTDLKSPKFGRPETYQLMPLSTGRMQANLQYAVIHESRLAIFNGKRPSRQTQPGQRESWGDSELSRTYQILADYGISWGSAATILHEFGHGVLKLKGFADQNATKDGQENIHRRLEWIALAKSTLHAVAIDAEDDFIRANTPLTGLSDVLEQMAYVVAAAAGYPVSVLLDIVRGGLQTGDTSVRNWYSEVDNFRNAETKPPLEQCLRWIMRSSAGPLAGAEPPVWSVAFRPLWEPSEKENAETFKTYADADEKNIKNGVYSADDAAKSRHGGDGLGTKITIDWPARKKQQEADRVAAAELDKAALQAMGRAGNADAERADVESRAEERRQREERRLQRTDEDGPGVGIAFAGLPIVIEHRKGTLRDGKYKMRFDYGYIVGSEGEDGDSVDVYLGANEDATHAYVIRQMKGGEFDEHKVMLGFDSANHARDAYLAQYDEESMFGGIDAIPIDEFRKMPETGGHDAG